MMRYCLSLNNLKRENQLNFNCLENKALNPDITLSSFQLNYYFNFEIVQLNAELYVNSELV